MTQSSGCTFALAIWPPVYQQAGLHDRWGEHEYEQKTGTGSSFGRHFGEKPKI